MPPSLDAVAANPALAANLSAAQRQGIVQHCAAVILALSKPEPLAHADPVPKEEADKQRPPIAIRAEMITPRELAARIKLTHGTIKNRPHHWTERDGVYRLGPKCTRIDWRAFMARLSEGKLGSKGAK
jgi:hypothetical protein